ncbi:MAG: hypothetical protein M3Y71_04715 [Actinomycetota bacterium]|nr:hypothetical protein [Actinomycetota bacterium]
MYYDIAFVLLHHDEIDEIGSGATESPAEVVLRRLGPPVELRTALEDLRANFADDEAQGTPAYVGQHGLNHPETDEAVGGRDG